MRRAAAALLALLPAPAAAQTYGQVLWGLQLGVNPAPLVIFDGTQNVQLGTVDGIAHAFQISAPISTSSLTVTGTATINNLTLTGTASGGNLVTGATLPLQVTANLVNFTNQSANTVLAGPATGAAAAPAFRALVTADVATLLGANSTATPANPAGTASTTGVMAGLAASITTSKSGTVLILISGSGANSTAADGCVTQIRVSAVAGQGAPANAAALIGTALGATLKGAVGTNSYAFTNAALATGLTAGSNWWIDLSEAAATGGTCTLTGITVTAVEL